MIGIATPRLVLPPVFGAVTAALLVLLMSWLISAEDIRLTEAPPLLTMDFVEVREDRALPPKREHPTPPPPPEPEPARRIPQPTINTGTQIHLVGNEEPPAPIPSPSGSGAALPVVKPGAIYPARALARGIEGNVVVEFRITASGATDAIRIISSEPPGVFDAAAREAVRRYRYRPQQVGGVPIAVEGLRERLVFEIEKR